MRLGAPIFEDVSDPERWIDVLKRNGYGAAYCPVPLNAQTDVIHSFAKAAEHAKITIAEVGAWSNPLSPDEKIRQAALKKCSAALELAEEIGACCCVNISGSRGTQWAGPHPENLTVETFDAIVESVRCIIDSVQPKRTFYALEMMPWMYPDSPDCYLNLIQAVDRKQFGAHLDPVNLINSLQRYYSNGQLVRECIAKLGPHIKSCHAKDIIISERLTLHLDETRPGKGELDYCTYLRELNQLPLDTPLLAEHLSNADEYALAVEHIRTVAKNVDVTIY